MISPLETPDLTKQIKTVMIDSRNIYCREYLFFVCLFLGFRAWFSAAHLLKDPPPQKEVFSFHNL